MSLLYLNLLTILALSPSVTSELKHSTCVDCNNVTGDNCIIEKTGFKCFPTNKRSYRYRQINNTFFEGDPPESSNMSACIPESLDIEIKHVTNYCCVWSPELGCQLIRGKRVPKTALECARCMIHDLNSLVEPYCPCVDSLSERCDSTPSNLIGGVMFVLWTSAYYSN